MQNINEDTAQSKIKVCIEEYTKPLPDNMITTQPLTIKPFDSVYFPSMKSMTIYIIK